MAIAMVSASSLRWCVLLSTFCHFLAVHSYLDRVYTANDARYLSSVIASSQDSDSALFEKSLLTTFYATEALLLNNEHTKIGNAEQLCATLRSQSASSWEEFHHLLMTRSRLHGCLDSVKASSLKKLNDGPTASKLSTVHFAVDAIHGLASRDPALYDTTTLDIVGVLRHVRTFQLSDQLFAEQANGKSSVHKTAIALSVAAKLLNMPHLSPAQKQSLQSDEMQTLLSSYMEAANALVRNYVKIGDDKICYSNSLTATSVVLESIEAFLNALQQSQFASMTALFTKFGELKYMESVARYVLSFTSTTSPTSARHVLVLTHMFQKSPIFTSSAAARPLSISVQNKVFSDSDAEKAHESPLTVRVSDMFGAPVLASNANTRVEIKFCQDREHDRSGPTGAFTAQNDGQSFVFDFGGDIRRNAPPSDENEVHGFYSLRLEISDDHVVPSVSVTTTVKVTTSLGKTVFGVAYAKKAEDGYHRVAYPDRISAADTTYEVSPTQKLKFEIQTRALQKPRQIVVEFVNSRTGESVLQMVPKPRQQKFALTIDLNKEAFAPLRAEGTYSVNLVIGDALYRQCLTWTQILQISCIEEEEDEADADEYEPVNDEVPTWTPKPAIAHTFGGSESPPLVVFPLVFCGVVALPLLAFLYFVFVSMEVSLVFDRDTQICSLSFIVALCSIGGVLFMFWWQWNIFEAGAWLSIVSAPAVWFGYTVLKMHLKKRISKQE